MRVYSPIYGSGTVVQRFKTVEAAFSGGNLLTVGAPASNNRLLTDVLASFDAPSSYAGGAYGCDYTGTPVPTTKSLQRTVAYV
jgi:hypothetical protein